MLLVPASKAANIRSTAVQRAKKHDGVTIVKKISADYILIEADVPTVSVLGFALLRLALAHSLPTMRTCFCRKFNRAGSRLIIARCARDALERAPVSKSFDAAMRNKPRSAGT